jgi:hypothetical protein
MKMRLRFLSVILLLGAVAALSSGCLLNVFQTAKLIQSGDMSLVVGSGLIDLSVNDTPSWTLTPQARMTFGLSDKVNLGFQTGLMVPLSTGEPSWMGFTGDLKFGLMNDPESVAMALGFGGGSGIHFLGWGVFGEFYLDLNVFPLFFAYQPTIPLSGDTFVIWHDATVGLCLNLSPTARLLIEVDTRNLTMWSYGMAFEISF